MECDLKNKVFKEEYEKIIDKLIEIFSLSKDQFNYYFEKLPFGLKLFLFEMYQNNRKIYKHEEDLYDKSLEVFFYYYKINNSKKEKFTLRNIEHLNKFEIFLDKMIFILENDQSKFLELFPRCPVIYWDRIDDLRETSFKGYRDSDRFTKCLKKSKFLSFEYEKLGGFNTENDEI